MTVTTEFIDSISFDIAKQKYYNANKVDAKMAEIKTALHELLEENKRLKAESGSVGEMKEQAAQLMLAAQEQASRIESEAKKQAEEIIERARAQADGIIASKHVREDGTGLTAAQMEAIDRINKQLDDLSVAQATQIFRIKQALLGIAIDKR